MSQGHTKNGKECLFLEKKIEAYCWSAGEFCWQTLLQMSWKVRLCRDTRSSSSLMEKYSFFCSCAIPSLCLNIFCTRVWHCFCWKIARNHSFWPTCLALHVKKKKVALRIILSFPTCISRFSCCSCWVWLSCWTALPRQRSSRSCTLVFTVARRPSSSVALWECWAAWFMCSWTSSLQTDKAGRNNNLINNQAMRINSPSAPTSHSLPLFCKFGIVNNS